MIKEAICPKTGWIEDGETTTGAVGAAASFPNAVVVKAKRVAKVATEINFMVVVQLNVKV